MGSKKYRNKKCAYCANDSFTGDHVVAREFFPDVLRPGLPQVPVCISCNTAKSKLEQYLTTVLPFAGQHEATTYGLRDRLPDRLKRNAALARQLEESFHRHGHIGEQRQRAVEIRYPPLDDYIKYVTRGLLSHHFDVVLGDDFEVATRLVRRDHPAAVDKIFVEPRPDGTLVSKTFANGALHYRGWALGRDPRVSLWHVCIYSGLQFGDGAESPVNPITHNYDFVGMTGRIGTVTASLERAMRVDQQVN